MNDTQTIRDECVRNIDELTTWLDSHPPRDHWTADMYQARADRLRSVMMWRAKMSLLTREV